MAALRVKKKPRDRKTATLKAQPSAQKSDWKEIHSHSDPNIYLWVQQKQVVLIFFFMFFCIV